MFPEILKPKKKNGILIKLNNKIINFKYEIK